MDKTKPPLTFGVFKPTGHTLMAFRSHDALLDAMHQMIRQGFEAASMVQYAPEEMRQQLDDELTNASPVSRFGYEVLLSRQHLHLAEDGCSFLLVRVANTKQEEKLADLVEQLQPQAAQHYGRFLIRDLTENKPGTQIGL